MSGMVLMEKLTIPLFTSISPSASRITALRSLGVATKEKAELLALKVEPVVPPKCLAYRKSCKSAETDSLSR